MVKKVEKTFRWINPLLQGLSYWLGYKKQLFRHYPLSEGAIVAEALHLIYSNSEVGEKLICEHMYKRMNPKLLSLNNARADIVIKDAGENIIAIIEVKRQKAPDGMINRDLERLALAKMFLPDTKCYLLLVSQNKRPANYVTVKGVGIKSSIIKESYIMNVRRVCKASDTFKKIDNANYTCLIEVNNHQGTLSK